MKVYCISGLGADQRVFDNLQVQYEKVPILWQASYLGESLNQYAQRLSNQIDTSEPFVLLGVSFGGMIASEMNHFITPEKTILVSSVAISSELPSWIRFLGKSNINRFIPSFLYMAPPQFVIWNSKVKSPYGKKIMRALMKSADPAFNKICIDQILRWKNNAIPENLFRIHGDNDNLLPAPRKDYYYKIRNAGHFAIVENTDQINEYVSEILNS